MKRSLRSWLWRIPLRQEVDEELAFHIDMRTRELVARGMDPAAAREAALQHAGDVARVTRTCVAIARKRDREMRLTQWLDELTRDVTFGMRQLSAAKGFACVAALTLALGIGANGAVFGVVKSVLMDPLPYADADRLVRVYGRRADGSQERGPLSAGTVSDIAERQSSFERVAAFVDFASDGVYGGDGSPRIARIGWVEPGFFEVLGVPAAHGRTLEYDDATTGLVPLSGGQDGEDTARGVLLTHSAWQRLFGGAPDVVGQRVRLNGVTRSVAGILPDGFAGPMGDVDFYLAFDRDPIVAHPILARGAQWLGLVGRLKPGSTQDAARRDVTAIGAELAREFPHDNGSLAITAMPLRDALVGDARTPLLALMASAALVLLIACANLAGALLSRAVARRKEFAVRAALGAGRGRLTRQLLTETTLLAVIGGGLGLLLASALLDLLRAVALPALPAYADLALDGGAVLVMAAISVCTGVVFGVVPAVAASRRDPQRPLRDESLAAGESRHSGRLRGVLVAAQLALCVSLLVGAGLLARSLWAMTSAPLGFNSDGVLTATIQLPSADYSTAESHARFHEAFTDRLRALPGVTGVAYASAVPTAVRQRAGFFVVGAPPPPADAQPLVLFAVVSDEYFATLGIPIRQGRAFDGRDRDDTPPRVVISERLARQYWPRGGAIGSLIRLGPDPESTPIEVVGIVADVRNDRARADAEPMVYGSMRLSPRPTARFLLRAHGDPAALTRAIERELAQLDPGVPLQQAMTLTDVLGTGLASRRLPVLLMTAFGALALLLASVGVYAMFASMTAAREREFGVRMALGSAPRAIAALVLRQGAVWMAAGLAGGAVGIAFVARLIGGLLYEVPPFDPLTLGASVAILVICATVALLAPVRRATKVDPASALRAQ